MLKIGLILAFIAFNSSAQTLISTIAEKYIGTPYAANGPLGEGELGRFDQDPLYRFDAFDCTTFVETVMALAASASRKDFLEKLNNIRYQEGQVDYLKRNHIISLDWIPNNLRAGHIESAMEDFSEQFKKTAIGVFNKSGWISFHTIERLQLPALSNEEKALRLEELKKHANSFQKENARLEYIVVDKLLDNWRSFTRQTSGDYIMNIVRPNWKLSHLIGTNLHISHQGVLSKQGGELYFIHASSGGAVIKTKLRTYLSKYKGHDTIKGINLLRARN